MQIKVSFEFWNQKALGEKKNNDFWLTSLLINNIYVVYFYKV